MRSPRVACARIAVPSGRWDLALYACAFSHKPLMLFASSSAPTSGRRWSGWRRRRPSLLETRMIVATVGDPLITRPVFIA